MIIWTNNTTWNKSFIETVFDEPNVQQPRNDDKSSVSTKESEMDNLGLQPVENEDNIESKEENKEDEESEIDDSEEAEQTKIESETIDNSITENDSEDEKMEANNGNEIEEKD